MLNPSPSPRQSSNTRLAHTLLCILLGGFLIVYCKLVLCPLMCSLLIAILLLPLALFFEHRLKLHRAAAALLSVLSLIGALALIFYFLGAQVGNLIQDWPQFKAQMVNSFYQLQQYLANRFNIAAEKQMKFMHNASTGVMNSYTKVLSETFLSVSSVVIFFFLMILDTFFILLYRRILLTFLVSLFRQQEAVVFDIVNEVQFIMRKYIMGLLLEMSIVAATCSIAFWLIGIKYSLLLGVVTGMLNIIPYLGIYAALVLTLIISFATGAAASTLLLIIATCIIMHLIDSNILLPFVVGSRVRINALVTILGLGIGALMWGIPGMFLTIPTIAILKIIFDRIEALKPFGLLLGDNSRKLKPVFFKRKVKDGS